MDRIECYVRFIKESEGLKSVLRTAWAADGRRESTAEHSWRLALLACLMLEERPGLDAGKVLTMCLIHDMGELYGGDISAALKPDQDLKYQEECDAVQRVFGHLPLPSQQRMTEIWKEYNENLTPEAHLVKALDKAETIIQHNQGKNPKDFDYEFNLQYGSEYFKGDPSLEALRAIIDADTQKHIG